jgi:hypothetical protein
MQTVQFQCGHCGNLMGVSHEYLGQQVRCPTCQEVVVAPAAESTNSPESDTDSLFLANLESAPVGNAPKPDLQAAATATTPTPTDTASSPDTSLPWNDHAARASDSESPVARAQRQAAAGGISWLWLLPVLSYAILATALAVFLYFKLQEAKAEPHNEELKLMPDLNGEAPLKKELSFTPKKERTALPLPEGWKTKLGQSVKVGSLEVTPVSVEKKVVKLKQEGRGAKPCRHESLVLHLKVTNLSDTFAFVPVEDFFDRKYSGTGVPPFTCLELAPDQRFYGGPGTWYPIGSPQRLQREWVEGRQNLVLKPGESAETFVCTDGNDTDLDKRLKDHEGELFWRVHVRCGPVRYHDNDVDKLVAATAVVGVAFSDRDYRKSV